MTDALLAFETLACVRGGRQIFAGLSGQVSKGDTLVVTGPNGSGKSSLLRLLAGLNSPAAGNIRHVGDYAYMGHDVALKPAFSVEEELHFWCRLKGVPAHLDHALAAMGLHDLRHVPCRLLSSGQRRRAALARVLCSGAPLWLLDEPTVGLDTASVDCLTQALVRHVGSGGGLVMATHISLDVPGRRDLVLA